MKDIYQLLNSVTQKAFPEIPYKWDVWTLNDSNILFDIAGWGNPITTFVRDNFEKGLNALLDVINSTDLSDEEKAYACLLLAALANGTINVYSNSREDKAGIASKLYRSKPIFKKCIIEYAPLVYNLISNIIAYSFFNLDYKTVVDISESCVSKSYANKDLYNKLLKQLSDKFTYNHMFEKMVTEENALKYWEIFNYIDQVIPELHFSDVRDGKIISEIKKDIDSINKARSIINMVDKGVLWVNQEELPEYLEFWFRYPNGINGDLMRYIFEEYGETQKESSSSWRGKISSEYYDLFEIFSTITNYITFDPNFFEIFDTHHLPTILYKERYSVTQTYEFGRIYNKELMEILNSHKAEQKKKRTDLYAKLILTGRTSPKWKSEAQLYALVSSKYTDAIYQYRVNWLGMQSLDIFIPSISVGIEYQGIQHYQAIEHFGGEENFKRQQRNDRKKKLLCEQHGINLIAWSYRETITETNLRKLLKDVGIEMW